MMSESIEQLIKELKLLKLNSTDVVCWRSCCDTVRGPFNRWFQVLNPDRKIQGKDIIVAHGSNDAKYCAAAMNAVPDLIIEIERLNELLTQGGSK